MCVSQHPGVRIAWVMGWRDTVWEGENSSLDCFSIRSGRRGGGAVAARTGEKAIMCSLFFFFFPHPPYPSPWTKERSYRPTTSKINFWFTPVNSHISRKKKRERRVGRGAPTVPHQHQLLQQFFFPVGGGGGRREERMRPSQVGPR